MDLPASFTGGCLCGGGALCVLRATPVHGELPKSGNEATRNFCADCGSQLFAFSSGRSDFIGIKAGSLDDPRWYQPMVDMWGSSAQPWDCLDASIPNMPKGGAMPRRE